VKKKVIPVITGVNGTISKPFRQYLTIILEMHKMKEPRKKIKHPYWALHTHCGK
jgi:hypothetical protein